MRYFLTALGLVAGLALATPARAQETCRSAVSSLDPVVNTTAITVARQAEAKWVNVQNKSTTDCYLTFGPEALTTTGSTGFYVKGSDYTIHRFPYGQRVGSLQVACKAAGVTLHVDQCR